MDERKKLSDKKRASNSKWDSANLKRMSLAIPIALYDDLKAHTDNTGESVNGFIRRAIEHELNKCNDDSH